MHITCILKWKNRVVADDARCIAVEESAALNANRLLFVQLRIGIIYKGTCRLRLRLGDHTRAGHHHPHVGRRFTNSAWAWMRTTQTNRRELQRWLRPAMQGPPFSAGIRCQTGANCRLHCTWTGAWMPELLQRPLKTRRWKKMWCVVWWRTDSRVAW